MQLQRLNIDRLTLKGARRGGRPNQWPFSESRGVQHSRSLCSAPLYNTRVLFFPSSKEVFDSSSVFREKLFSDWSVGTSSPSAPHVVSPLSKVIQERGGGLGKQKMCETNKTVACASRQQAKGTEMSQNNHKNADKITQIRVATPSSAAPSENESYSSPLSAHTESWHASAIKQGYCLQFAVKPPFFSKLEEEISSLLRKRAIQVVPPEDSHDGFYS